MSGEPKAARRVRTRTSWTRNSNNASNPAQSLWEAARVSPLVRNAYPICAGTGRPHYLKR